jgi:hypothetical protein
MCSHYQPWRPLQNSGTCRYVAGIATDGLAASLTAVLEDSSSRDMLHQSGAAQPTWRMPSPPWSSQRARRWQQRAVSGWRAPAAGACCCRVGAGRNAASTCLLLTSTASKASQSCTCMSAHHVISSFDACCIQNQANLQWFGATRVCCALYAGRLLNGKRLCEAGLLSFR